MKPYVIIGSVAACHHFADFRSCGKDIDVICKDDDMQRTMEASMSHFFERREIKSLESLDDCDGFKKILEDEDSIIASPETLHTLKVSHVFWNIHWPKTMRDICFFQSHKIGINESLFDVLYEQWTKAHGKKKARIDVTNELLFDDAVDRYYVHDSIHEAVAYGDKPLYQSLQLDPDRALLSKEKFESLSHDDKLNLCREEIYVIAIERFLLTQMTFNTHVAYMWAMKALMTRMSKGWFPKFMAMNLDSLKVADIDFWKQFNNNKHKLVKV